MNNLNLSGKKYFELSDDQRVSWLRLIRSQNVGPATFRDLISHYGTADRALEALPELARHGGAASRIRISSIDDALKELDLATRIGARFVGIGEPDYPPALRAAEACPPLICVLGSCETLCRQSLAVVGSRNASIAGHKLAQRLSAEISQEGYTIVSGLARGIDTAAHKASVDRGTTAVFAGGVNHVFPEQNTELARQILDKKGAIVSEMPLGWQPRSHDFPRRNRIITGLSQAVLVVEAARRSGSLITARLANEMGRSVLAVPGSPLDPRSEGTNNLIRSGATLIRSADDIMEALSPLDSAFASQQDYHLEQDRSIYEAGEQSLAELGDDTRQKLADMIGPSPVHIDDIVRLCDASPAAVQLALLEMSLAGVLERHPGGLVSRIIAPKMSD